MRIRAASVEAVPHVAPPACSSQGPPFRCAFERRSKLLKFVRADTILSKAFQPRRADIGPNYNHRRIEERKREDSSGNCCPDRRRGCEWQRRHSKSCA